MGCTACVKGGEQFIDFLKPISMRTHAFSKSLSKKKKTANEDEDELSDLNEDELNELESQEYIETEAGQYIEKNDSGYKNCR